MKRENFGSRIGFIFASAGCAIGIGNIWKFPYITGQNGGGVFVLFYLLFLIFMGAPILTMELAVGRASRKSAVLGFKSLEKNGSKWHILGFFGTAGCYLLMMYYTTVSGWMLNYFVKFLKGTFSTPEAIESGTAEVFTKMLSNPAEMLIFMAVTVILGFFVCSAGLQKGLERITKIMMSALLILIVVLAIRSMTLRGAEEGLFFYIHADFARARQIGLSQVITSAMNQAFFTLSLGVGGMEIFGSYMSKDKTLMGESLWICGLDTFVAITSGFVIFPACFSFAIKPDAGPSLIFITLPNVFMNMKSGRIWGTLFFLFMTFASFSTVIAVFENLITSLMDNFSWSRKKSVIINCIFILTTSIPSVLGYNLLSGVHILGNRNILDSEDFIVSTFLLPLGSLAYLLFCCTKWGWGLDKYIEEANTGNGFKISKFFKPYFQFVLPVLILAIFIAGLISA